MRYIWRFVMDRRGSSLVFLAMVFVAMMGAIMASITVARCLVIRSHTEVYGHLWSKAILGEYDRHLLEDYGIMAYQGTEIDVAKRLRYYEEYSLTGSLDSHIGPPSIALEPYRMSDPENFRKAMSLSFKTDAVREIFERKKRVSNDSKEDETEEDSTVGSHVIGNQVVLDTLPSHGHDKEVPISDIVKKLKEGEMLSSISGAAKSSAVEMLFIRRYFNNHMTMSDDKPGYLGNEWEYIVKGSPDDQKNYEACCRRIYVIRNALDLASLSKDPEKMELITAAASMITPGPAEPVTQAVLMEAWAALEAEEDLKTLKSGGRVPLIKTSATWKTDLGTVIDGNEVAEKLDEEARKNLEEHRDDIKGEQGTVPEITSEITEGQDYDDYIQFLIMMTPEETRLLRVMDIVQIEMKYRYYDDFNLDEYHCGVAFNLEANGRNYEITDEYQ